MAYMRMDCTTDRYTCNFQFGGRRPCFIRGESFLEASMALEILVEIFFWLFDLGSKYTPKYFTASGIGTRRSSNCVGKYCGS